MEQRRPLLVIHDQRLLEHVLRLAAAAGCAVAGPETTAARGDWAAAPMVLLDDTGAESCLAAGFPRRPGVFLVSLGAPAPALCRSAVKIGADNLLELPADDVVLAEEFADLQERPDRPGVAVAVFGGRGGAGASVLATALALHAARRGDRTLLVDGDPLGGGLDLLLGAEDDPGLRWPGLALTGGRVAATALHAALPHPVLGDGRISLLSCDRTGSGPHPDAARAVVAAGKRAGDTVVCDLPRTLDGVALAALDGTDLGVLVVPAEVRACAAAAQLAARLADRGAPLGVVVRGPAPSGLNPQEVAAAVGLPLLAAMPPETGVARDVDRGRLSMRPRGPLAAAAAAVFARLAAAAGARP